MDLEQLRQILDLVKQHDLSEFEVEHEGLRLRIRTTARVPVPVPSGGPGTLPLFPSAAPTDAAPALPVVAGMVFTIEPGAYLPGWGGIRIEDDVVVTPSGVGLLTTATTELIEK